MGLMHKKKSFFGYTCSLAGSKALEIISLPDSFGGVAGIFGGLRRESPFFRPRLILLCYELISIFQVDKFVDRV